MDGNYYLAANKPSPPRFDALHTTDSRPSRVCRHALRTSGGESCAPILRPLLPTHELRPAGAHGRHGRGQGDAQPAAGRHGLARQQGRHAAGNDRQGGFLPHHGRLPLRPDFPRLGTYVGYKPFKKRYGNTEFRGRIEVKMEVDEQSIAQVVVVGQQVAMVFRGDTTVYNAGRSKPWPTTVSRSC